MNSQCEAPITLAELIDYRFGDLSQARAEAVEEHYFACASCARRLAAIERLGEEVAAMVRGGEVSVSVGTEWLKRAAEQGLTIRTYPVEVGVPVACTVAPEDDFVALRLALSSSASDQAPPPDRVDVHTAWLDLESGTHHELAFPDVVVDANSREIVLLSPGAQIRSVPRSRWTMTLRTSSGASMGPYVLNHTPWAQLTERH